MDFLEQNFINHLENEMPGDEYRFRERKCEKMLNELGEREFRKNFRFSKQVVRDIAAILHDFLGLDNYTSKYISKHALY